MTKYDQAYWQSRYEQGQTGWDIGYPAPPITHYINQIQDKSLKILIPGAGNAHEAEYIHRAGFANVHVIDIAQAPLQNLQSRYPDFPSDQLHQGNFFDHQAQYDLILEQTFFCAIDRKLRPAYVTKCHELLHDGGKIAGLLWAKEMSKDSPPFGGDASEYTALFSPLFHILLMEITPHSIPPRQGNELIIELQKA